MVSKISAPVDDGGIWSIGAGYSIGGSVVQQPKWRFDIACAHSVRHATFMEPKNVCDQDTFIEFLSYLRADLRDPKTAASWENRELESFLEAMLSWVVDWQKPCSTNVWQHAATLLAAAKIYE
ncbi:hypothetical protein J2T09_004175 [Neorhizobium huautlense]|uniref:DUF7660 domain-containing protein n=1 Tax=Neorhizobium huautlense TaxID=67774 RepID=A0ABT9PY37_9HYPH|nr:hypothetical protein [Neorhizobium huautlense]MDP9839399.1 hypothetical protein [Neorhizobium huautlense]